MQCDYFHVHIFAYLCQVLLLFHHDADKGQDIHGSLLEAKNGSEHEHFRDHALATAGWGEVHQALPACQYLCVSTQALSLPSKQLSDLGIFVKLLANPWRYTPELESQLLSLLWLGLHLIDLCPADASLANPTQNLPLSNRCFRSTESTCLLAFDQAAIERDIVLLPLHALGIDEVLPQTKVLLYVVAVFVLDPWQTHSLEHLELEINPLPLVQHLVVVI